MAKTKTTPKPQSKRKPADPDARITGAAVKYVQCIAAIAASYGADPDGNFKNAERGGFRREARAALTFLCKRRATTPQGLYAKAHVVPAIIDDDTGWLENGGTEFLATFAGDVKDFAGSLVMAGWKKSAAQKVQS